MKKISIFLFLIPLSFYWLVKFTFLNIEPLYRSTLVGKVDMLAVAIVVCTLLVMMIKAKSEDIGFDEVTNKKRNLFFIVLIIAIFLISGIYNLNKKALDWDAVALYDSRAKILETGYKFSEMTSLSKYDDKNKYYYLLYPPFTSVEHLIWYKIDSLEIPVSFVYTINLVVMAVLFGVIVYPFLGLSWTLFTTLLLVGNRDMFSISLIEYTNLPFATYMTLAIMSLLYALKTDKKVFYLLGFTLLSVTPWIRYMEPIWLCVMISLTVSLYILKKLRKGAPILLLGLVIVVLQYFSWGYFQKIVASNPEIFKVTPLIILESIAGVFSGAFLSILIYYLKSFGINILLYMIALIKVNSNEPKEYVFLRLVIVTSLLLYFAGMYGISFMFDWWKELSGSLVRSSSYLIPISLVLIVSNSKYVLEKIFTSGKTISFGQILRMIKNDKK